MILLGKEFEVLFGKRYLEMSDEERKWIRYSIVLSCHKDHTPLISTKMQSMISKNEGEYSKKSVRLTYDKRISALKNLKDLINNISSIDPLKVSEQHLTELTNLKVSLPTKSTLITGNEYRDFFKQRTNILSSKVIEYYRGIFDSNIHNVFYEIYYARPNDKKKGMRQKELWRNISAKDRKELTRIAKTYVFKNFKSSLKYKIQEFPAKLGEVTSELGFSILFWELKRSFGMRNQSIYDDKQHPIFYALFLEATKALTAPRSQFIIQWSDTVKNNFSRLNSNSEIRKYASSLYIDHLDSSVPEINIWKEFENNAKERLVKAEEELVRLSNERYWRKAKLEKIKQKKIANMGGLRQAYSESETLLYAGKDLINIPNVSTPPTPEDISYVYLRAKQLVDNNWGFYNEREAIRIPVGYGKYTYLRIITSDIKHCNKIDNFYYNCLYKLVDQRYTGDISGNKIETATSGLVGILSTALSGFVDKGYKNGTFQLTDRGWFSRSILESLTYYKERGIRVENALRELK